MRSPLTPSIQTQIRSANCESCGKLFCYIPEHGVKCPFCEFPVRECFDAQKEIAQMTLNYGNRYVWFRCTACGNLEPRFANQQCCPRCHGRTLVRERIATQPEMEAMFNEKIKRLNEIPE